VRSDTLRHDVRLVGEAFGIRPVELQDSAFILSLRRDPDLSRFLNPVTDSDADQIAWLKAYLERQGDYYWIVDSNRLGREEGTIGLYNVDRNTGNAEWGRWVLRHGSLAAVESALLAYQFGFETLELDEMYCRTRAENLTVVSFHDSTGLARRPGAMTTTTAGRRWQIVEHFLSRAAWPGVRELLAERAGAVAEMIGRRSR
jgi:RimJ/RimL family protein N-acetyltransferase